MKKYETKVVEIDPFCIMCGEGPMDEIEYWKEISEEELKEIHEENLMIDEDFRKGFIIAEDWEFTPKSFEEWINQSIADGDIREVA